MTNKPTNIDEYIATFPAETQILLRQLRSTIAEAAPEAGETISYGIPAFKLNGMLVWFAAHTNHIGLYPRGSGIEEFRDELKHFKLSKGTIQFPLNRPLPIDLITRIVQFRMKENLQKTKK